MYGDKDMHNICLVNKNKLNYPISFFFCVRRHDTYGVMAPNTEHSFFIFFFTVSLTFRGNHHNCQRVSTFAILLARSSKKKEYEQL